MSQQKLDLGRLANKQVLVTGATGFIGSQFVPRLVESGARVIAAAPALGWRPWVTKLVEEGKVTFVEADALTLKGVERLTPYLTDTDYVVHLARVWAQGNTPLELAADETTCNLLGTIRFLEVAAERVSGIAYSSSVEVYGPPRQLPLREDHSLHPVSPYAVAKLAVEGFLKTHAVQTGIAIAVLRYATVYGPGELVPRAVPNFIRAVLGGEPPQINGEGLDVRDYVYVADVVGATLRALAAAREGAHVYNVGTGVGCTTSDLARLIIRLAEVHLEPVHRPCNRIPLEIVCDISKARAELCYSPAFTLEQGLTVEIQWFQDNPTFLRR